jgi:hypothetical protein
MRRALLFLAGGAAACGGGAASTKTDTKPEPAAAALDISSVKDDLTVFTDGQSHYFVVLVPDPEKDPPTNGELHLFYGDGKTMNAVKVFSSEADGMKFDVGFDDPRVPISPVGSVKREHGQVALTCWGKDVPLTEVKGDDAKKILSSATFQHYAPRWRPWAIGKDKDGNLTYLDYGNDPEHAQKNRLWMGKPGSMKEVEIVNTDHDQDWSHVTFATKQGNLQAEMVHNNEGTNFKLTWEGKPSLFLMDRTTEWKLIFNELKIYAARSPTPCDPMIE